MGKSTHTQNICLGVLPFHAQQVKFLSVQSKSPAHGSVSLTAICLYHFHQDLLHLEERLGTVNRGASQGTIERCTYPHKYKKVSTCESVCSCGLYIYSVQWIMNILCIVLHVCYSLFWDRVRSGLLCLFQTSDVLPTFRKYCSVFYQRLQL